MIKLCFIAVTVMLVTGLSSHAQKDSSGIYSSAEDFANKKLSLAIDCRTEKHKIRINDFFGKNYVTVIHDHTPYKFYKDEIYGYKACDGGIVRFLKKKELLLLNSGESIAIYRHDVAKPPRGKTNVTNYYFSKDATSPVFRLTITNLKNAFFENPLFIEMVTKQFKYNTELATYDVAQGVYKLNELLSLSINQQKIITLNNKL